MSLVGTSPRDLGRREPPRPGEGKHTNAESDTTSDLRPNRTFHHHQPAQPCKQPPPNQHRHPQRIAQTDSHSQGPRRRAASHIKNPWNIQEERQGEATHLGPSMAQLLLESINVSSASANWEQLMARTAHITLIQEHCLTDARANTFKTR